MEATFRRILVALAALVSFGCGGDPGDVVSAATDSAGAAAPSGGAAASTASTAHAGAPDERGPAGADPGAAGKVAAGAVATAANSAAGASASGSGASGSRASAAGAGARSAGMSAALSGAGALPAAGSSAAGAGAAGMGASTSGAGALPAMGGSAGGAGEPASAYRPCPTGGAACKIMPFGDSITDGYNPNTPGGYRIELFRAAHAAGKNITFVGSGSNGPDMVDGAAFPRNHEGHSGWTIAPAGGRSGISTLVASVMPQHTPDIVLLMIGTNDAIDNYDMANAPKRLGALIDAIYTQLPDVLIVVATLIPARGDTSMGDDAELNTRITRFNEAVPAVVKQHADAGKHILSVDTYAPFESNTRALLEDQWHPNAAGYERIGAGWYEVLEPLL